MLALEIFALICTTIAVIFTALTIVEIHFEKKEEARRAKQKAFAEQVRAWCENPHDASLRWW